MNFIDKLERRFGRFGIPNLMRYVIGVNILGLIINLVNPDIYYRYLSLDVYQILHGQIWRLVTFVLYPVSFSDSQNYIMALFWFAIWALVYYNIGTALERIWGTFRFTLFYLGGVIFIIIVTFLFVVVGMNTGVPLNYLSAAIKRGVTLEYLNQSLFLAFAIMFPDMEFLLYFIIPVKAKWLAILYFLLNIYQLVNCFMGGYYFTMALIAGSLVNLAIFLAFAKGKPGVQGAYRQKKRKVQYKRKVQEASSSGTIHRCAICGRTEKDAPGLEFRYCSKCEGNYEYCSDHLFTHEHVHK